MATIALLTDYGLEDHYVGVVKGVILNINKEAKIVDISHQVQPHNIKEATYLLAVSYKYFPKYTIHLVVVDPGVGSARRIILDIEKVQLKHNKLVGKIIHIDKFGNLITNIRKEDLQHLDNYQIKIKNEIINKLSYSYQDVDKGKLLAIIGSSNFLEISINQDNAKEKLNVEGEQEIEVLLC